MKRSGWSRPLSLSSTKMTIQTHRSWLRNAAYWALFAAVCGAVAYWAYSLGNRIPGIKSAVSPEQVTALRQQVEKLTAERDLLIAASNAVESTLNIERSAQQQLAKQVKSLQTENNKLTEDLAFFDSLLPTDTGAQGITIRRLKIDAPMPGQLRYRLLVMQGGKGKGKAEFVGNLQLAVTVSQGGKNVMMVFPDAKASDGGKYKINFAHYQRLEGVVTLPDGAVVKTVQARVLEKGQMRAQQSASL